MIEFARGYSCAVATLIQMEGCVSTNSKELFQAGGWSVKQLSELGIEKSDLDLFKKYQDELEPTQRMK